MSESVCPGIITALQSEDKSGRGLRIEFLQLSDRYSHRVYAIGCEEVPVLLLESVEATVNEDYPSSPVLQTLNVSDHLSEDDTRQRSAMLLGMSGKGHWSLSVQAGPSDSAGLAFDVACRIKKIPDSLGSCYSWGKRVEVEETNHIPRLHFGSGSCLVELWEEKSYGLPWVCDRYIRTLMFSASGDPLLVKPPLTVRWMYRIVLAVP